LIEVAFFDVQASFLDDAGHFEHGISAAALQNLIAFRIEAFLMAAVTMLAISDRGTN